LKILRKFFELSRSNFWLNEVVVEVKYYGFCQDWPDSLLCFAMCGPNHLYPPGGLNPKSNISDHRAFASSQK
jgi:hypothetical protein